MENCYNVFIPTKEFYNSRTAPLTSVPSTVDTWYNKGVDTFTIEVSGATSIQATVKGCIKITDENGSRIPATSRPFTKMSVIDLTTLQPVDTITKNGLYSVGVIGVANITLEISELAGEVTICGSTGVWGN